MRTPRPEPRPDTHGLDPFLLALVDAHLASLRDANASPAERERRYVALRVLLAGGALS